MKIKTSKLTQMKQIKIIGADPEIVSTSLIQGQYSYLNRLESFSSESSTRTVPEEEDEGGDSPVLKHLKGK